MHKHGLRRYPYLDVDPTLVLDRFHAPVSPERDAEPVDNAENGTKSAAKPG
jgi:hypothetical protein